VLNDLHKWLTEDVRSQRTTDGVKFYTRALEQAPAGLNFIRLAVRSFGAGHLDLYKGVIIAGITRLLPSL
jgi:hypothetical protein